MLELQYYNIATIGVRSFLTFSLTANRYNRTPEVRSSLDGMVGMRTQFKGQTFNIISYKSQTDRRGLYNDVIALEVEKV